MANTFIIQFSSLRLTTIRGVRDHIMRMRDIAVQLKSLEVEMSDTFLVHYVLCTLPHQYGPLKISYNTHKDKWSITELLTMCVQEENMLLMEAGERQKQDVNFTTSGKNKKSNQSKDKGKGKIHHQKNIKKEVVCFFCKKNGHIKKQCSKFMACLDKKGLARPAETSEK